MIACSKEQLLVFDNSPVLLRAPGKRPQEATPQTLGNCVFLDLPPPLPPRLPSEIPLPFVGFFFRTTHLVIPEVLGPRHVVTPSP